MAWGSAALVSAAAARTLSHDSDIQSTKREWITKKVYMIDLNMVGKTRMIHTHI